jgi:hypothetical protein
MPSLRWNEFATMTALGIKLSFYVQRFALIVLKKQVFMVTAPCSYL